jgi:hypothetical protein
MNPDEQVRPEWWEVQVGNLLADPEALRELLDALGTEMRHLHQELERARNLCVRLEGELARLEAGP